MSEQEARESLEHVGDAAARTRKMVAYAGGDALFIVWGVIWVLGFLSCQFLPLSASWIWSALNGAGIVITLVVVKTRMPVKSPWDRRIGWFWWLLFLYAGLWLSLLAPFIEVRGHEESQVFWKHLGAMAATLPMFAYVVIGLWLEHFMVWIGLLVTALTLVGLFALQPFFWIWMAATGGGTLIGTGLLIRNRWK